MTVCGPTGPYVTPCRPARGDLMEESTPVPKNKTHSGAKKRFRITGTGKIMREQAGARHLLEHKSSRRTRRLASDQVVSAVDTPKIKKLLGK